MNGLRTGKTGLRSGRSGLGRPSYRYTAQANVLSSEPVELETEQVITPELTLLDTGEYVLKSDYDKLSQSDQDLLKTKGIDAYNQSLSTATQPTAAETTEITTTETPVLTAKELNKGIGPVKPYLDPEKRAWALKIAKAGEQAKYVKLESGEYVTRDDYVSLSRGDQVLLSQKGIEGFNTEKKAQLEANNVKLNTGEYVDKDFYKNLDTESRDTLYYYGIDYYNQKIAEYEAQNIRLSTGESIPLDVYASLSREEQELLYQKGSGAFLTSAPISPEKQFEILKTRDSNIPSDAVFAGAVWNEDKKAYQISYTSPSIPAVQPAGLVVPPWIGGHEVVEELIPYTNIPGTQVNAVQFLVDKGITPDNVKILQQVLSDKAIAQSLQTANAINELKPYSGDLAQYIRDNPSTQNLTIFQQAGIPADVAGAALQQSKLAPNFDKYVDLYVEQRGGYEAIRQKGESLEDYQARLQRETDLIREAQQSYYDKYGAEKAVGSVLAEPIGFIFPAARALAPDVELKDIKGSEWVLTAANALFLLAMPLGGIAGTVGSVLSKGAILAGMGASTAYTAMEWDNMTPLERSVALTIDVALAASVLGRPFVNWLKTTDLGDDLRLAVNKVRLQMRGVELPKGRSIGASYSEKIAVAQALEDSRGVQTARVGIKQDTRGVITTKTISRQEMESAVNDALDALKNSRAAAGRKAIEELEKAIAGSKRPITQKDVAHWIEEVAAKEEVARVMPTGGQKGQYEAWLEKIRAIPEYKPAPLKGSVAIIPKVEVPAVAYKPFIEGEILAGMSKLTPVLSTATIALLNQQYGITIANIAGTIPLTNTQLLSIAKTTGMTQEQISIAVKSNALSQAIIKQLAQTQVHSVTETEALVSALSKTAIAVEPIVSQEIIQQTMPEQLAQSQQYQKAQVITQPISLAIQPAVMPLIKPALLTKVEIAQQVDLLEQIDKIIDTDRGKPPVSGTDYEPIEGFKPTEETLKPLPVPVLSISAQKKKKDEELRQEFAGGIAFKHGFGWVVLKKPYYRKEDRHFFYKNPPPGVITDDAYGEGAAYRTIQQYIVDNDLPEIHFKRGIMKIDIYRPGNEPGQKGAIVFTTTQRGRDMDKTDELFSDKEEDLRVSLPNLPDIVPPQLEKIKQKPQKTEPMIQHEAPSGFRVG